MPATISRASSGPKKLTIAAAALASDVLDVESSLYGIIRPGGGWAYDIGFQTSGEANEYRPADSQLQPAPVFGLIRDANGDPVKIANAMPEDWHLIPVGVLACRFLKIVALDKATGAVVAPGGAIYAYVVLKS